MWLFLVIVSSQNRCFVEKSFQVVAWNLFQNSWTGRTGLEVIKLCSCSTPLRMKFILLINVKMPTIFDILTFISMINTISERTSLFVSILAYMSS